MKFGFILEEKANYAVTLLCEALGVSRSGFYAWRRRRPGPRADRNAELLREISSIHREMKERYGSPRMQRELVARGFFAGRHRVARLMKTANMRARRRRSFTRTTDSSHGFHVAPNVLDRKFEVATPDQVWAADITYVATREGWLYLAVVIDLCSRFVVGWATGSSIDVGLVQSALQMAIGRRQPAPGLLHHSDRGSQYASGDYQRLLLKSGMRCSMSRKGNCWDNAPVESFFGSLKVELVNGETFTTRIAAAAAIREYIELFFNRRRLHSALGYKAPATFERLRVA